MKRTCEVAFDLSDECVGGDRPRARASCSWMIYEDSSESDDEGRADSMQSEGEGAREGANGGGWETESVSADSQGTSHTFATTTTVATSITNTLPTTRRPYENCPWLKPYVDSSASDDEPDDGTGDSTFEDYRNAFLEHPGENSNGHRRRNAASVASGATSTTTSTTTTRVSVASRCALGVLPKSRKQLRRALESENAVSDLLMQTCGCGGYCYQTFRVACGSTPRAIKAVLEMRAERFDQKFDDQFNYLRRLIEQSHSYDPIKEVHRFDWILRSVEHGLGVKVCEEVWFNVRGYRVPLLNSTARRVMTTLRKRKHAPPLERRRIITGHSARWHATEAWITKYIGLHGQPRPAAEGVVGQIFLAKREMTDRHTIYVKDLTGDGTHSKAQTGHFQYGQFRHVWQETAKVWKSPEGDLFDVVESEERVRGFKRCNRCEFVHEKIVKAKTKEEREFWRKKQERH